jgi:hypothetical protein
MTVYDLRALFDQKFSIHLEICEKNPVYSNAIFKGKQERVTVRVDGRRYDAFFIRISGKFTAED